MFALAQASALGPLLAIGLSAGRAIGRCAVFALYERSVAEPIWPMSLWRDRVASSGNIVSLALGATTMGIAAYLPLYIQGVIGNSATVSGFVIMAMSASGPIGAMTAGQFMLRVVLSRDRQRRRRHLYRRQHHDVAARRAEQRRIG